MFLSHPYLENTTIGIHTYKNTYIHTYIHNYVHIYMKVCISAIINCHIYFLCFPYSAGVDLQHNPAYASTMTKDKTDSASEVVYEKCT